MVKYISRLPREWLASSATGATARATCARGPCRIPSLIEDTTDVRLRNQGAAFALSPAHAAGGSGETVEPPHDGVRVPGGAVLPEHRGSLARRRRQLQQRGELEPRRRAEQR